MYVFWVSLAIFVVLYCSGFIQFVALVRLVGVLLFDVCLLGGLFCFS